MRYFTSSFNWIVLALLSSLFLFGCAHPRRISDEAADKIAYQWLQENSRHEEQCFMTIKFSRDPATTMEGYALYCFYDCLEIPYLVDRENKVWRMRKLCNVR